MPLKNISMWSNFRLLLWMLPLTLVVHMVALLKVHQIHHNTYESHDSLTFVVSLFYLCTYFNLWQISLLVVKPEITGVNRTSDPVVGEPFFLECKYTGVPSPNVVWSKDRRVLSELDDTIKIVPTDSSSRLEITQATSTDFSGIYECNISNIAGFASQSFHITIQG